MPSVRPGSPVITNSLPLSAGHRHFDHRAAPFVAIEHGWFAAEGLGAVTVDASGEDDRTIEALLGGRIDIGLDISPAKVLHDRMAGGSLVIVGAMANGVGQVLAGVPSLRSVEDLRGKRIHVVEQGSGVDWHPLRILLRHRGIDPDRDVTLVPNAPYPLFKNALPVFERGEADARMLLHAEMPHILAASYRVLFDFMQAYPADYPQRTIVTTRSFAADHADKLAAFLRAMIRSYRFLRDKAQYGRAMTIVRKHVTDEGLGFPPGVTDHFMSSHYFGFKQMPHDGGVSAASLQRYINEETMEGRLPPGLGAASVLNPTFAEEAAREINGRYGSGWA